MDFWAQKYGGLRRAPQQGSSSVTAAATGCWRTPFASFYLKISFYQLSQRLCCPARLQRPNLFPFAKEQSIKSVLGYSVRSKERAERMKGRKWYKWQAEVFWKDWSPWNCSQKYCNRIVFLIWTNTSCSHPSFTQTTIPLILSFLEQQQHPNATESLNQVSHRNSSLGETEF